MAGNINRFLKTAAVFRKWGAGLLAAAGFGGWGSLSSAAALSSTSSASSTSSQSSALAAAHEHREDAEDVEDVEDAGDRDAPPDSAVVKASRVMAAAEPLGR